jgi:transposase-like protein
MLRWATLRPHEAGGRRACGAIGARASGSRRLGGTGPPDSSIAARQLYRCTGCGRRITARTDSAFSGYRFSDDIIVLAVRWYLRYRLSYVEVAEWLAERGVTADPSTISNRVQDFTPRFVEAARAHRTRAGARWRVDETRLKIGGRWRYVFRAIDEHDQVVDVYLSDHRDAASARAFFKRAMPATGVTPTRVTSD